MVNVIAPLLVLGIIISGFAAINLSSSSPLAGVSSTQISQTSTTTIGNQKYNVSTTTLPISINPLASTNGFGNDLGNIQSKFRVNGEFSLTNIYGQNLTISPISINGLQQSSSTIYYNSTTEVFSFGTLQVYYKELSNGFKISIIGNLPLAENISVAIPNVSGICDSNNNTECAQVSSGYEYFSWIDSLNYHPSWNNVSKVLTWQINSSQISNIVIDPLALDGSAFAHYSAVTSGTVSLTTTSSPDVIIIQIGANSIGLNGVSSVTATGLTFHRRASIATSGLQDAEEWYAIASGTFSNTITISLGSVSAYLNIEAFGVSGANTGSPFDTNPTVPNATLTILNSPAYVSTNNANDFIFGFGDSSSAATSVGVGWTSIQSAVDFFISEYQIVSTTQTKLLLTTGSSSTQTDTNEAIEDAIVQASVSDCVIATTITGATTITTTNTCTSTTTTTTSTTTSTTTTTTNTSSTTTTTTTVTVTTSTLTSTSTATTTNQITPQNGDFTFFGLIAFLAVIFSILTFYIPSYGHYEIDTKDADYKSDLESMWGVGRIFTKARLVFFPLAAAGLWMILAILSITLLPSDSTSTGGNFDVAGGVLFGLLGIAYVIITIFAIISVWAVHMKAVAQGL